MEEKTQQRKAGSKPYECVRRAWHSHRHKPIRGSLIQEIFRVVNEAHSSDTKKNTEWQDKLPVLVLRAEEILYSKANSEAEYVDLKTLWNRTNDAIDTIIRRDDTSESGHFLHPCIEAALNLGCPATSAPRSQRNCRSSNDLRCYLPRDIVYNGIQPGSTHLRKECRPSATSCSVYPLYYGSCVDKEEEKDTQFGFGAHPMFDSGDSEPVSRVEIHCRGDVTCCRNEVNCDLSPWLGCQPAADVRDTHKQGCLLEGSRFGNGIPKREVESCSSKLNGVEMLDVQMKKRKADVFPLHIVKEQQQHLCLKPRLSI